MMTLGMSLSIAFLVREHTTNKKKRRQHLLALSTTPSQETTLSPGELEEQRIMRLDAESSGRSGDGANSSIPGQQDTKLDPNSSDFAGLYGQMPVDLDPASADFVGMQFRDQEPEQSQRQSSSPEQSQPSPTRYEYGMALPEESLEKDEPMHDDSISYYRQESTMAPENPYSNEEEFSDSQPQEIPYNPYAIPDTYASPYTYQSSTDQANRQ